MTKEINEVLTKIQRSHTSVAVTILGDRTGLTIARVARLLVKETLGEYDLESIGAIGSAVFMGASEQGNTLSLGDLELMIAEFGEGKILTSQCGLHGILIVVTDDSTQLGLIRMQLKDASKMLADLMNEIATTQDPLARQEESQSIMEALKELEQF
ncbi:MAG: roadblock/LC7 domain-containing protein [Candidatus Hodarchaeales archaeon]|jgi:predicted regulator of Ras-like GTPase activity (Roadblock/LC7/MglB family)